MLEVLKKAQIRYGELEIGPLKDIFETSDHIDYPSFLTNGAFSELSQTSGNTSQILLWTLIIKLAIASIFQVFLNSKDHDLGNILFTDNLVAQ